MAGDQVEAIAARRPYLPSVSQMPLKSLAASTTPIPKRLASGTTDIFDTTKGADPLIPPTKATILSAACRFRSRKISEERLGDAATTDRFWSHS